MSDGGDQDGVQDIAPSNAGRAPGWQPQPLERGPFERTLKAFFQQRHFVLDPAALVTAGRPVDLYLLHRTVFEMGGFCKVEANNAWDVVGGKLGFVNFPGSDGQPPHSGPGVSLQIAQYYKDYVQAFDAAYLRTMLESQVKAGTGSQELTEQHRNQVIAMVRNFTGFDLLRTQHPQTMSEQQMMQLVNFAYRTVVELHSMNVPENIIQMVEARRSDLQQLYQDQVNFKGMVAQNGGVMRPGQPQSLMQNGGGGPGGTGGRPMQPPFSAAAGGLPGQMQERMLAQGSVLNAQGNFMDGRMQGQPGMQMGGIGPPLPQHQQAGPMQHRMISGIPGHAAGGQFHATIQTKERIQSALVNLAKLRREATEAIHHLLPIEIPPDQRAAYNSLLESVHRMSLDFDPKLPILYSLIKNDDHIRRIVKIISVVQFQRTLCSQNIPHIIISLDALRACQTELVRLNDAFTLAMKQADAMQQNQQGHSQSQESSLQTATLNYATTHSAQQQGLNKNQLVQANGSGLDPDSEVDPLIEALSSLSLP